MCAGLRTRISRRWTTAIAAVVSAGISGGPCRPPGWGLGRCNGPPYSSAGTLQQKSLLTWIYRQTSHSAHRKSNQKVEIMVLTS